MWGNWQGWTISALIVALCGGWLYFIANASSPTPATHFSADPRHFAPIALPAPPPGALPTWTPSDDAGALYRRAIDLYLSERPTYDDFVRLGTLDSQAAGKMAAIDLLVQAAPARDVKLFTAQPGSIINYNRNKPPLDALQTLGRICIDRFGLLNQRAGRNEEAMKHYQAAFALGWQLASERLTYDELAIGLELIAKASAGMRGVGEGELATSLRAFDAQRADYVRQRIEPLVRITRAVDLQLVGAHTGDVFELAQRAQERMWRVEAILALGRVRHFAGAGGTRANQANAAMLLRELADKDPDPLIRTAAAAARNLTREQHLMQ